MGWAPCPPEPEPEEEPEGDPEPGPDVPEPGSDPVFARVPVGWGNSDKAWAVAVPASLPDDLSA